MQQAPVSLRGVACLGLREERWTEGSRGREQADEQPDDIPELRRLNFCR